MELIATKNFKMGNRRIAKGERFTCDNALGHVYVTIKTAEYPPRILKPAPKPEPERTPVYQTRVMTADVATPIVPVKRGRGRPRKIRPELDGRDGGSGRE